jgi:hypothetical protein
MPLKGAEMETPLRRMILKDRLLAVYVQAGGPIALGVRMHEEVR